MSGAPDRGWLVRDEQQFFFTSIFFVTLLSIVFLKAKVGLHRWASIIVGFCGVLVVVGPKGGGDISGYLLVLAGDMAYSMLLHLRSHIELI